MTSAEKLTLKFQGYAELSGDYRINPDDTISIPVLGRISIAGLTPAELEAVLVERATKLTGRDSFITVEIPEYKPVFVTGYVTRPGATPWKPGMTVLHAMTLSGGVYRATVDVSGAVPAGADAEISRLKRAISDLKRTIAAAARFQAERDDSDTIEIPTDLVALVGQADAEQLIAAQNTALDQPAHWPVGAGRGTGSCPQDRRAGATTVCAPRAERVKAFLNTRRNYKEKIEGLQAKGYVRADRGMEEQARVSELEDRLATVSVGIARVQSTLAALERDKIYLQQERRAAIDAELLRLDREGAQLQIEIEAARQSYRKLTGVEAPSTFTEREAPKPMIMEFEIVRQSTGGSAKIKGEINSTLLPGDIVIATTRLD